MGIKVNNLSKNIVDIMTALSQNQGLAQLLVNNEQNPFQKQITNLKDIARPSSDICRIYPYPFDPEAQIEDSSFIRVYYNQAEFNSNETIQEMDLHIDIIVAKNLWLINDNSRPLIRPYEIMDRVIDIVGKRSINNLISVKFDGWQHLAVNTKFDAIRLYSQYYSVEAENHYGF